MRRKSTPGFPAIPSVTLNNYAFFAKYESDIGDTLKALLTHMQERCSDPKSKLWEMAKSAEILLDIQLRVGLVTPRVGNLPSLEEKEKMLAELKRRTADPTRGYPGGAEAGHSAAGGEATAEEAQAPGRPVPDLESLDS